MATFLGCLLADANITCLVGRGSQVPSVRCVPSSAWQTSLRPPGTPSWILPHFSLSTANTSSINFQETSNKHPQQSHFSTLDIQPPATRIKKHLFYNYYILLFTEPWLCGRWFCRHFVHIPLNPRHDSLRVRSSSLKGRGSVTLTIMCRITP